MAGLAPGPSTAERVCDIVCDVWCPQDAEGFGDRLFLKQRMNLLSQMTSTPIDCLFKVRVQDAF